MISICLFVRYCWPCHCIVCPFRYTFSDYPFIIYINDIVLSVLLRYTESDCSFIIYIVFFVLLRYTDSDCSFIIYIVFFVLLRYTESDCSFIIYIVFFVLLRYTDSDCSFDIFKLWLYIWNKSYSVYVVHSFRLIWNGFVSFGFMVFNATFNTISVISCRSVLLVEETEDPKKNTDLSQVTYQIMLLTSRFKLTTSWWMHT